MKPDIVNGRIRLDAITHNANKLQLHGLADDQIKLVKGDVDRSLLPNVTRIALVYVNRPCPESFEFYKMIGILI